MAESFDHKKYRNKLADELWAKSKTKTEQRSHLKEARSTNEYGSARQSRVDDLEKLGKRGLSQEREDLYESLEAEIGDTPLVELEGKLPNGNRLFVKEEFENGIGHSHYDRVYIKLFKEKERLGLIRPGADVFETTSGTAGVSFAAIGRRLGYICHVAIPLGGQKARENALDDERALVHLTPEEGYVGNFPRFIARAKINHPDWTFLNHSMGNILGVGTDVNENALESMHEIADEITSSLQDEKIPDPVVLSALGNGTNTLGISERLKQAAPNSKIIAYRLSPILFEALKKTDTEKSLKHPAPGTSYPTDRITFPALEKALKAVDGVKDVADAATAQMYMERTGHNLPPDVVATNWKVFDPDLEQFGRSTLMGIDVARKLAESSENQSYVVIGYDTSDRYDQTGNRETPTYRHVAVLGAQGNFGSSLSRRLAEIKNDSVGIRPTVDKSFNNEIASESDLLIVAVQPDKISDLLHKIAHAAEKKPSLRPDAQVLSFAANIPLATLSAQSGKPAARMMADPWWNISAYIKEDDFSTEGLEYIFEGLTKELPRELSSDREIDTFTTQLSYLFAVLLLEKMNLLPNAGKHRAFLSDALNLPAEHFDEFEMGEDPERSLGTIATKGGVAERFVDALRAEPDIDPSALFDRISNGL